MKHPRICFVLRALRLKEMESNVKRKEEELKKKSLTSKTKEQLFNDNLLAISAKQQSIDALK